MAEACGEIKIRVQNVIWAGYTAMSWTSSGPDTLPCPGHHLGRTYCHVLDVIWAGHTAMSWTSSGPDTYRPYDGARSPGHRQLTNYIKGQPNRIAADWPAAGYWYSRYWPTRPSTGVAAQPAQLISSTTREPCATARRIRATHCRTSQGDKGGSSWMT